MKVVEKNKPIPVEETITIELTKTELAILVSDVGATNGWKSAEEYCSCVSKIGLPEINVYHFAVVHGELYCQLIEALEEW